MTGSAFVMQHHTVHQARLHTLTANAPEQGQGAVQGPAPNLLSQPDSLFLMQAGNGSPVLHAVLTSRACSVAISPFMVSQSCDAHRSQNAEWYAVRCQIIRTPQRRSAETHAKAAAHVGRVPKFKS